MIKNKIFILEDHPIMLKALSDWFAKTGRWELTGAASTLAAAKELLPGVSADIVLLDIQLEDGWGLDIIPFIQKEWEGRNKKPIMAVYSTFDSQAHVAAAVGMGVKTYITKRRGEEALEAALLDALAGKFYIDESARVKYEKVNDYMKLLTKREAEVLCLVKTGLSNTEIAGRLDINCRTVENYLVRVYSKTGIKSRSQLQKL